MPFSNADMRRALVKRVQHNHPNGIGSLLDVGSGYGQVTALLKETIEIRFAVGLEIWWPYLADELHRSMFDVMLVGDVRRILPLFGRYTIEVILVLDVLEHLGRTDAQKALHDLRSCVSVTGRIYLATPLGDYLQDETYGNPHEEHKSTWTREDWEVEGFTYVAAGGCNGLFEWRRS